MSGNEHKNRLDNSEFNTAHTTRDVAPASVDKSEEQRLYEYMRTLKLRAEIEKAADLKVSINTNVYNKADGTWGKKEIKKDIMELLPQDSEFEKTRKLVLISLNKEGPESEKFRKYASRFGTNSTFELSSRIANYVLDEKRRRETYNDLVEGPLKA